MNFDFESAPIFLKGAELLFNVSTVINKLINDTLLGKVFCAFCMLQVVA